MTKQAVKRLSVRRRLKAVAQVAKLAYKASPVAVAAKIFGILASALLPIATTYFAALTTTALAEAYGGDETAGGRVITYMLVTAGLGVAMTAWNSLEQYVSQVSRYKIEAAMNDRMYEHFLALDFWRYDDKTTIDLFDKAKNFATFFAYVFDRLGGVASSFFTMVGGLIALAVVSWWLGLILIAAVIPGLIVQFRLSRRSTEHWNENIETRRAQYMIETMFQPRYIAELRLYGMVRHLLDLRLRLRDSDEKVRIDFERSFILKRLGADAIEAGAEVAALVYTALQIIAHTQPVGQFLYVQQMISRALGGAGGFVGQINSLDEDMANLFDYQQFMELEEAQGGTRQLESQPETIELRNVSFHYPQNERLVLQDVSFTIQRGQHVAIVGENGAGKSTLIKLLVGLYQPTEGKILVDGVSLADYDIASWHRQLSVMQQDHLMYDFASVKDNVYFGDVSRVFDQKRFEGALEGAEATGFVGKLPKKEASYVSTWMEDADGTKGIELSGGQWQRLAMARNFYRQSPVVILDEPTSAIDALAESRIFKRLFKQDRTIVTISHRLSTVEKADVIYMLEDGKLVEQGTHAELVKKKGAYFTMFRSQFR